MKNFLILIMLVAMCITFVGCKKEATDQVNDETITSTIEDEKTESNTDSNIDNSIKNQITTDNNNNTQIVSVADKLSFKNTTDKSILSFYYYEESLVKIEMVIQCDSDDAAKEMESNYNSNLYKEYYSNVSRNERTLTVQYSDVLMKPYKSITRNLLETTMKDIGYTPM